MKRYFLCLMALMILLPIRADEKRIALLIGNSAYNEISVLSNPVNDITALEEMLNLLGFDVIKAADLSQAGMKRTIDEFGAKLDQYDVGLFFYSGHGMQYNGQNYLIPVDAKIESEADIEYNSVNAGRILAKMENSKTTTNIIIFDACRNNPFRKSWTRTVQKNGLAFMEAPTGSIIAYSTAPGQTASDGDGKYGLYTESLLSKLGHPGLNIIQVFQEVRRNVREESGGKQIPWESTSLEADFYFNQTYDEIAFAKIETPIRSQGVTINKREIKSSINSIKEKPDYFWAEADGMTIEEADRIAMEKIVGKIKARYSAVNDANDDYGIKRYIEELQPIMARRVYKSGKSYTAFRYIPESEIKTQFTLKKSKILAAWESALEAESNNKTGEAIKYLYWSYALRKDFPESQQNSIQDEEELISLSEIDSKLKSNIQSVEVVVTDSGRYQGLKRYKVRFETKGKTIPYTGYYYWTGNSWSDLNTTSNGTGFIDLYYDIPVNELKIKLEYKYLLNTSHDKFMNDIVEHLNYPEIDNLVMLTARIVSDTGKMIKPFLSDSYATVVHRLINNVKTANNLYDPELFTPEGFETYKDLLLYGNASFFEEADSYQTFITPDNIYIRDIDVKFNFPNSSSEFIENLSLELDKNGRINNISFSLDQKAVAGVLAQRRWPEHSKWLIINFLENYKTAYALKRLDYLNKIFSDNALIIVGKRIEESASPDDNIYSYMGENYVLTRYTKDQYMYRLRRVFDNNEYINIRFEDNVIRKRDNQSNVYGINIKQNYFSSTYSDQGYLFLMVDIKENSDPVIYVRSWQPEKFDDGHIISLSDFTY